MRLRSAIKAKRELLIVEKLDKDTTAGGLELLESKERVNKVRATERPRDSKMRLCWVP